MKVRKWISNIVILCVAIQKEIKLRLQSVSVILVLLNIRKPVLQLAFCIWRGVCLQFLTFFEKPNKNPLSNSSTWNHINHMEGSCTGLKFVPRGIKTSFLREHETQHESKLHRYFLDADGWQVSETGYNLKSWWSQIICAYSQVVFSYFCFLPGLIHDLFCLIPSSYFLSQTFSFLSVCISSPILKRYSTSH